MLVPPPTPDHDPCSSAISQVSSSPSVSWMNFFQPGKGGGAFPDEALAVVGQ